MPGLNCNDSGDLKFLSCQSSVSNSMVIGDQNGDVGIIKNLETNPSFVLLGKGQPQEEEQTPVPWSTSPVVQIIPISNNNLLCCVFLCGWVVCWDSRSLQLLSTVNVFEKRGERGGEKEKGEEEREREEQKSWIEGEKIICATGGEDLSRNEGGIIWVVSNLGYFLRLSVSPKNSCHAGGDCRHGRSICCECCAGNGCQSGCDCCDCCSFFVVSGTVCDQERFCRGLGENVGLRGCCAESGGNLFVSYGEMIYCLQEVSSNSFIILFFLVFYSSNQQILKLSFTAKSRISKTISPS